MLKTVPAVVRDGRIELLESMPLVEGARLLVTLLSDGEEQEFWRRVSEHALRKVWGNPEDDVYANLLTR
jgi:hypothetical protein